MLLGDTCVLDLNKFEILLYMLTCTDVLSMLVVLPVLIMQAGLRMHGTVGLSWMLRRSWKCRVLDLRLWVGSTLRGDDPCGCEELVYGGTQVGHLSGIQRPVVELSLSHALFQT